MKKIFLAFCCLCFFSAASFAQYFGEDDDDEIETTQPGRKNICGSTFSPPKNAKEFWAQVSPTANVGVMITINTEDKNKSGPSPANFALSVGAIWPNNAFISFQPRLSFYTTYYLWHYRDQFAYPAEVENRTALALSFLIDLPAAMTFRFEKNQIEAGLGIALLARIAIMAGDVPKDDFGSTDKRTAGDDRNDIQKWFWSDMRFLYPEIFLAWEYRFSPKITAGLEARWYLPLGSLTTGRGLDASIIAVSAKLIF